MEIRKKLVDFKSEKGYLMLSTLFLLILSGIMTQGIIKISANHLVQLNQLARNYQEKAVFNLAESVLRDQLINEENRTIKSAKLTSSVGDMELSKIKVDEYELLLINSNNKKIKKHIKIDFLTDQELEKTEDLEKNIE